jgi:L-rhamnose mutarotase
MREDGLLFGYFEAEESFEASRAGMAKEEVNERWQSFMAPFFEGLGGAHADQNMAELEEVFHLD